MNKSKKLGMFFIGYLFAIVIIYIAPIIIMFPDVIGIKTNSPFVSEQYYESAINKIKSANLQNELNIFNAAAVHSTVNQVNFRSNVIIFYAVMLFICLLVIGQLLIKNVEKKKFFGKGIICGSFVGAAGLTATILFSATFFIR